LLTGRPTAKTFPNKGLHLRCVMGLLVGSMRVARVWADVILHWHTGMEVRKEWTSSAVSIWDPNKTAKSCGVSRCPQLLQDGDASVPAFILGCLSSGSVNPTWKAACLGALQLSCLSRCTLSEQGCGIQVCGTTVGANRWCFPQSLSVLIHPRKSVQCLPRIWSS